MTALLALIPVKDWLYGGAIVLLIVFGIHIHHKLLAEGIAEQQAADAKASAIIQAQTAKQTAELQARATMAEQAYDKEVNSLSNQPVASVRLCNYSHSGGSLMSKTGAAQPGASGAGSTSGNLQSVPSGNPSGGIGTAGPDIGAMLSALAQAADRNDAALREFQDRE